MTAPVGSAVPGTRTTAGATRPHSRPPALESLVAVARPERVGVVTSAVGLSLEVVGLSCGIGDLVHVGDGPHPLDAEVVATAEGRARCMPLGRLSGVRAGDPVRTRGTGVLVPTGRGLFGRVVDALGRPVDGRGPLGRAPRVPVDADAPAAMERARIDTPLQTGVRVLDTLTTLGRGQRIGLFAGSGVGKSSLLSMVARGTDAEVSVIALVGERGREVREFLEDDLGPEGLARSVVVVATSDEPAMMRRRAAFTATRIAESFREAGSHVVLMMDSLTRVSMAQREIGLSVGEPPATRGYPPSTFSLMGNLLERAGTAATGSVTGIYTVLVDGDDHNEPIADQARSILDGHVVLDRSIAVSGHYPAVDALASVSRVASRVTTPEQRSVALTLRRVLAARRKAQDILDIGAYKKGTDPLVDASLEHQGAIDAFLQQVMTDRTPAEESWARLTRLTQVLAGGED